MLKSEITTLENEMDVFTSYKRKMLKGEVGREEQRKKPFLRCWKSGVNMQTTKVNHKKRSSETKIYRF